MSDMHIKEVSGIYGRMRMTHLLPYLHEHLYTKRQFPKNQCNDPLPSYLIKAGCVRTFDKQVVWMWGVLRNQSKMLTRQVNRLPLPIYDVYRTSMSGSGADLIVTYMWRPMDVTLLGSGAKIYRARSPRLGAQALQRGVKLVLWVMPC